MANESNVLITPVLHYKDLEAGVRFLAAAFGFREHQLHKGPDGEVVYAELVLGDFHLGMGQTAQGDSPFDLGPTALYVRLDDPDAMHEKAVAAGAAIVMELVDQEYGSREFAAKDPEGNVWCFGTYSAGQS